MAPIPNDSFGLERSAGGVPGAGSATPRARFPQGSACLRASVLALCLATVVSASPAGAWDAGRGAVQPGSDARWAFEPLGPDGARIARLAPLACDAWIALAADGSLFAWAPGSEEAADGAWEEIRLPARGGEPRALLFAVRPDRAAAAILDELGGLWSWSPLAADRPPALLGRIEEALARRVVALLAEDPSAAGATASTVLAVARDGRIARVADRTATWMPLFLGARGDGDSLRDASPPTVRGAWTVPGDPKTLLALCEWEGLFASRDGGRTFRPVERLPKQIGAACVHGVTGLVCAAAREGIFVSRDAGRSWELRGPAAPPGDAGGEDPIVLLRTAESPLGDELWAVTRGGALLRARLGDPRWERPLAGVPAEILWVGISRGESRAATSRGVIALPGEGPGWRWRNEGLRRVSVLSIAAGEASGAWTLRTDIGAFAGIDSAAGWVPVPEGALPPADGLGPLAACGSPREVVAPPGRQALWCAADGEGYWLGTDSGLFEGPALDDWTFAGLEEERVLEVLSGPPGAAWLFARTAERLYASDTRGAAWEQVPLPAGMRVAALALDVPGRRLLLGAYRHGLFAIPLPEPRLPEEPAVVIHARPNPFAGQVALHCELPAALVVAAGGESEARASIPGGSGATGLANLEARVYSVHGQLVRRLASPARVTTEPDGTVSLAWSWDGLNERGLPAANGVYLVTTAAGTQRVQGKLIKLR